MHNFFFLHFILPPLSLVFRKKLTIEDETFSFYFPFELFPHFYIFIDESNILNEVRIAFLLLQFSTIHLQARRIENEQEKKQSAEKIMMMITLTLLCWMDEWMNEWILWSYIFRECIWKHKMRTIFLIICYYRCSLNRTLSYWVERKKLPFNLELSQPLQSSFQFSILYNHPLLIFLSLSLNAIQ